MAQCVILFSITYVKELFKRQILEQKSDFNGMSKK